MRPTRCSRSISSWERAAGEWLAEPDRDRGLMLMNVAAESSTVAGSEAAATRIAAVLHGAPRDHPALRRMAVAALASKPPTGFLRQFVLEHTGERRGLLDIKRAGLLPVVDLARWAAVTAGATATATPARLDAAREGGTLEPRDVALLHDALDPFAALRMEHQASACARARRPTTSSTRRASRA